MTEPLQNKVYTAANHDFLTLNCSGTGTPPPNITLSYEHEGKLQTLRESVGSTISFQLIVNRSWKFYCSASNDIVSTSGKVEHIVDYYSITVDLIPEKDKN